MKTLDRNNYEIWFLDYLDGQLSDEQLGTLLDFLEQNPDLREELRGVSGVSLTAGSESIGQKDLLLKSAADIPGIAADDQVCIARMESDLSEEEARLFDRRLEQEPELGREYAAFLLTRLNPADTVVFPQKNSLRKKTVVFAPWLITAISSAAIILLAWFLWPDSSKVAGPELAKTEIPATSNPQPATRNPQPATRNPQPATCNPQPATRNPQPATFEKELRESIPMDRLARKSVLAGPRIPEPQSTRLLYASNYPIIMDSPLSETGVMTLPQYALKMFRERILGGDRTVVKQTKFSMWEVAGAGLNKINDVAGTNMKLNRDYDSNGEILAVSFNSRLLDVEAPVRNAGER